MDWNLISKVSKFTPINEVFNQFGEPKFKLGTRPVYYLGEGFLISYSEKKFKIENSNRIEFGDEGEYALNLYFFTNKKELELHFKIKNEEFDFGGEKIGQSFEINNSIAIGSTFEQTTKELRESSNGVYYQEGENRAFSNGKFGFQNNFVSCGNYTFLFFGKSKKTQLSAFQFTFLD